MDQYTVILTGQDRSRRIGCGTHKVAQHEASVLADALRREGLEVLGNQRDGYYLASDGSNVITIEIVKKAS